MKRLIALLAISAFVLQANAVTSSNTSTAQAPAQEAPKRNVINTMTVPVEGAKTVETQQVASELDLSDDQAVASEIQASEAAEAQAIRTRVENKSTSESNFYLSGSAGIGAYPEVNNINGQGAVNLAIGYMIDRTWMLELGAGYGLYKMDTINYAIANRRDNFDVNQYSAQLAVKYRLMDGNIVPNIGPVVSYTYRQFTLTNPYTTNANSSSVDAGNTSGTDAGIIAGVEFEMSESFALGVDLRYMFNISSSAARDTTVSNSVYNGSTGTSIERLQYYNAGVSARVNF